MGISKTIANSVTGYCAAQIEGKEKPGDIETNLQPAEIFFLVRFLF